MTRILLALLIALLAAPAWGTDDEDGWTDCAGTVSDNTSMKNISSRETHCYEWENVAATQDSPVFWIYDQALITCNLDTGDTNPPPGSPGVVTVRHCSPLRTPNGESGGATASATNCLSIGALDGTEGDAATQKASVRVRSGWYYFDLTTAVPDGDEAKCWIQGEKVY